MKLKFFAVAMPLALMLTACDKQEDKFAGFTAVGTDKKAAKFYLDTNTVKRNRSGWVSFNMVRDLTDSYVIQNAETNCDNRFFTLEGVKYRQDGTSQEKFAAETITLPADKDNADVTALVKMACDKAEENRMITGAFDDGKALEILYGNYDANTKTASWENIDPPSSLEDYDKFSGKTGTVKILESKDFTQDGNTKHIVLTSTSVSYPTDVLLSSTVFVKKGDKWQIEKEHSFLSIFDNEISEAHTNTEYEYPDLILAVNVAGGKTQEIYRFIDGKYEFFSSNDLNVFRTRFLKELAKSNHTKILFEHSFKDGGKELHVIFTQASVDESFENGEKTIGATTYQEVNGVWEILSKQLKIGQSDSGSSCAVIHEKISPFKLSSNKIAFLVDIEDCSGNRAGSTSQNIYVYNKDGWQNVGDIFTGSWANYGGVLYEYTGEISVIPSKKEYPDLLLKASGNNYDFESNQGSPAKNSLYVFNGKKYEEKQGAQIPAVKNEKVAAVQDTSAAKSSVMQMIDYAVDNGGVGHESEIQEAKLKIESSPKPKKGNKKAARKINDQALALLNTQDFSGAVVKFVEANRLDASDIEIVNNLGFAYLKQKNLESAQQTLITALMMFPDRAAAWSNLGDVFALSGDERKAVACYANTYRFSKDMAKTHQFMKKMNAAEDVPALKQARDGAMSWAQKVYPELQ